MDYKKRFLAMHQEKNKKNSWEEVEKRIGLIFPEDYKVFIDSCGEGAVNEFLWILSPFIENENLNSIEKFESTREAYISMQREFPEQCPFHFYNGKSGLFPWGITDNGDELFWNFKGDTLEIVVYEARYARNISYTMGMEEFSCKLLKREIECPIFILENNNYLKYTYQAPN